MLTTDKDEIAKSLDFSAIDESIRAAHIAYSSNHATVPDVSYISYNDPPVSDM